ncbi:uncharacterized protein UHOD_11855 [Ustilago sp. UG-2017b]|nr:uncharacterized protein UHOD_11855 [Ustilago sp. UG-2017b]
MSNAPLCPLRGFGQRRTLSGRPSVMGLIAQEAGRPIDPYEGSAGIRESGRWICSKHDRMADSTEISGKDDSATTATCEEWDQASPRRGPSSGACSWLPLRGRKMKT